MLPVLPQVMSITPLLTTVDKNRNLNPGAQFLSLSLSLPLMYQKCTFTLINFPVSVPLLISVFYLSLNYFS